MAVIKISATRISRNVRIDRKALHQKIATYMVGSTQRKINAGIKPANAPLTVAFKGNDLPLRDRGQLMSSITGRADGRSAVIGTNHIAAKTQQFGRTIHAKGKWLWIPASAETRRYMRRWGGPTDVLKGLREAGFRVWTHSRNGLSGAALAKKGKRGKVRVIYVLKKEVTIPPRPFLFIDETDRTIIQNYLSEAVQPKDEVKEDIQ